VTDDLQQDTTALLQRLIRFNTVNPPGAERRAQESIAADLREAGF
jgi:acetylornithine deacetylase/succinyl-diaminopimelate desuccinylase-like protein